MSYSVHVFPRETQAKYEAAGKPDFFEDTANLVAFEPAALERIEERLELVGFEPANTKNNGKSKDDARRFTNELWEADALLTKHGLYLSASGEGIFEITMFGSEIADDMLAKFDPQEGTWE